MIKTEMETQSVSHFLPLAAAEEFVSRLLVEFFFLDASGRKLNRALIEHVSPSAVSQDGSRCQLIHLFSLA